MAENTSEFVELSRENSAYRARLATAENADAATRRKLASMCETVMRCVRELEAELRTVEECGEIVCGAMPDVCKKLRAAVIAAT